MKEEKNANLKIDRIEALLNDDGTYRVLMHVIGAKCCQYNGKNWIESTTEGTAEIPIAKIHITAFANPYDNDDSESIILEIKNGETHNV